MASTNCWGTQYFTIFPKITQDLSRRCIATRRESVYSIDPALANGTSLDGKDLRDWAINTAVYLFKNMSHAESFL